MQSFPLVLMMVVSLGLPQQRRDAPPPLTGTGRIAGTVVDQESGRPVRFAEVFLVSSSAERKAVTDGTGTFSFDQLERGEYHLRVNKRGYLDTAYGQTRPGTDTPGKVIVLRDREPVVRLTVPLSHGGVISGVVRDERGDPIYGAVVGVARWRTSFGVRELQQLDSTKTDERGQYRLPLLAPRDYVLMALGPGDAVPDTESGPSPFGFANIFYPGTTSATTAETIKVGLGEIKTNIDFQLPLIALGGISGVVYDMNGRPAPEVMVSLEPRDPASGESGTSIRTGPDGKFEFPKIMPGPYTVTVSTIPTQHGVGFKFAGFGNQEWTVSIAGGVAKSKRLVLEEFSEAPATSVPPGSAASDVSVTGGNTANVTLTLEPPRKVTGRIVFEGTAKPPATMKEIRVDMAAIRGEYHPIGVSASDDGTFEFAHVVPGRYAIHVNGFVSPWALASIASGGMDVLDAWLEVPRDRDVRELTITIRDRETELSGAVTDSSGQPARERTVIVFPAEDHLWSGWLRVQAAVLGTDGMYAFDGLRPGRYLLAVVDGVEEGEWLEPAFLRSLFAAAVPVNLGDGEKKVQDLRVR